MKDGNALCVELAEGPDSKIEVKDQVSTEETPIKQLEENAEYDDTLSNEKDLKKQQEMLKSIDMIETIGKLKRLVKNFFVARFESWRIKKKPVALPSSARSFGIF